MTSGDRENQYCMVNILLLLLHLVMSSHGFCEYLGMCFISLYLPRVLLRLRDCVQLQLEYNNACTACTQVSLVKWIMCGHYNHIHFQPAAKGPARRLASGLLRYPFYSTKVRSCGPS